jgi:hypothetical protein
VSYRKKGDHFGPLSRRVKSAETLVVFPNLGWVLYFIRKLKKRKILSYIQWVPKVSEDQWGKCVFKNVPIIEFSRGKKMEKL